MDLPTLQEFIDYKWKSSNLLLTQWSNTIWITIWMIFRACRKMKCWKNTPKFLMSWKTFILSTPRYSLIKQNMGKFSQNQALTSLLSRQALSRNRFWQIKRYKNMDPKRNHLSVRFSTCILRQLWDIRERSLKLLSFTYRMAYSQVRI